MEVTKKQIGWIIAGLVVFFYIAGAFTGVFFIRDTPLVSRLIDRDTSFVDKTTRILDSLPSPTKVVQLKPIRLSIPPIQPSKAIRDTIRDTIRQYYYLPQEQRLYSGAGYQLAVSGYKPVLDYIYVDQIEKVRTITNTVFKEYGSQISINAGVSTAYHSGSVAPAIYCAFHYEREHLSTSTRAGIMYTNGAAKPFIEVATELKILRRKF